MEMQFKILPRRQPVDIVEFSPNFEGESKCGKLNGWLHNNYRDINNGFNVFFGGESLTTSFDRVVDHWKRTDQCRALNFTVI